MNSKFRFFKKFLCLLISLFLIIITNYTYLQAEEMPLKLDETEYARDNNEVIKIDQNGLETLRQLEPDILNLDTNKVEFTGEIVFHSGTFATKEEDTVESVVSKEAKNRTEKYSITVAVEQPNPGSYDCVALTYSDSKGKHVTGHTIGHTFIVLGDHSKKKYTYDSRGFYPYYPLSYNDVYNNTGVMGVIKNDEGHAFTIKKTYWVDLSTYNKAIEVIKDRNSKILADKNPDRIKYSIVDYNCTTFVKDIVDSIGLNSKIENHKWVIPKEIKDRFWRYFHIIAHFEKNSGCYPGAAGEQIR